MRGLLSAFGVLSALQLLSVVVAQDPPACVAECSAQVRADFTKFNCLSADDADCLCRATDFHNGLRDCASAKCGAGEADTQNYLKTTFCPNVEPPAESSSAPAESAAPSSEPPAPSTTEAAPASTSAPPPEPTTEPAAATTSSAPASSETSSANPSTTSASTTDKSAASSSTASTASTTSTGAPSANGDGKDDKSNEEKEGSGSSSDAGLSTAAKVGIAVAAVVAVAALIIIAWCLLKRRKVEAHRPAMAISHPLPGAGRVYAPSSDDAQYEKYGDIEMTTRYEDMVPRTQPRTMV